MADNTWQDLWTVARNEWAVNVSRSEYRKRHATLISSVHYPYNRLVLIMLYFSNIKLLCTSEAHRKLKLRNLGCMST